MATLPAGIIFHCILKEEGVKHEPVVQIHAGLQTCVRLLNGAGPFASEIDS